MTFSNVTNNVAAFREDPSIFTHCGAYVRKLASDRMAAHLSSELRLANLFLEVYFSSVLACTWLDSIIEPRF